MEEFTYEQIRAKALKQGVKDNKVHIGLWANLNNYLKTRRKKNGKVTTNYISLQKLAYYEGGNLAASKIRNLECPSYEICLIDYGCGKFNRKIHIMEQYP